MSGKQRLILSEEVITSNPPSIFLGVVVAVAGYQIPGGKFFVEDTCYCGVPSSTNINIDQSLLNGEDRYCFGIFLSIYVYVGTHFVVLRNIKLSISQY